MEMEDVARIETLQQLVDGTRGQSSGSGRPVEPRLGGLNERGPAKPFGALGWILGLLDLIQLFSRLGRRVVGRLGYFVLDRIPLGCCLGRIRNGPSP